MKDICTDYLMMMIAKMERRLVAFGISDTEVLSTPLSTETHCRYSTQDSAPTFHDILVEVSRSEEWNGGSRQSHFYSHRENQSTQSKPK